MQFTSVRSKEKDYDIYFKSEKLVHSQQEHEKNVSKLFQSGKNWFLAISSLTNTVAVIWKDKIGSLLFGDQKMQFTTVRSKEKDYRKKWIPAIWRPKNEVHNCQKQGKRL